MTLTPLKDTQQTAFGSASSSTSCFAEEVNHLFICFLLATQVSNFVMKQVLNIMRSLMGLWIKCVWYCSNIIKIKEAVSMPLHKGASIKDTCLAFKLQLKHVELHWGESSPVLCPPEQLQELTDCWWLSLKSVDSRIFLLFEYFQP